MCLRFSDFKILYRNLPKRLCNGNKEAETSQGTAGISLFSLSGKKKRKRKEKKKQSFILGRLLAGVSVHVMCSYCILGTTALIYMETKMRPQPHIHMSHSELWMKQKF